jgi:hypothetical protein
MDCFGIEQRKEAGRALARFWADFKFRLVFLFGGLYYKEIL